MLVAGTAFAETSRSVLVPSPAAAPDSISTLRPAAMASDSVPARPALRGVAPKTALYHSMALPGWGQLDNGRKVKALFFFAAEAFFVSGVVYEQSRLNKRGMTSYEREVARNDRNTFIIYWFGARVAGLVDAYVDAQLQGFNTRDVAPAGFKRPPDENTAH